MRWTTLIAGVSAAEWAVLIAGSSGYDNYRHQADVAHAYQIVKKHGIPESNIITLMVDDVANDDENPFPGKLFNRPTAAGTPGVDVYEGIKIDYKGSSVTPDTFVKVLTGDSTGLAEVGSGKVLKSTEDDHVFINYVDHGGPGIIGFPDGVMHVAELHAALKKMHTNKMYKKLVFYMEACESGSMFDDATMPPNFYATTATDASSSSWGTYCPGMKPGSMVDGKDIGSCLGDLYSIAWMEDTDAKDVTETIEQQFKAVKAEVKVKEPEQEFGDKTIKKDKIGDYLGSTGVDAIAPGTPEQRESMVSTRDIAMHQLYHRLLSAPEQKREKAAAELKAEIDQRQGADRVFKELARVAYPYDPMLQERAMTSTDAKPVNPDCELAIHYAMHECPSFRALSGYAMKFQRVAVNLCGDTTLGWAAKPAEAKAASLAACGHNSQLVV